MTIRQINQLCNIESIQITSLTVKLKNLQLLRTIAKKVFSMEGHISNILKKGHFSFPKCGRGTPLVSYNILLPLSRCTHRERVLIFMPLLESLTAYHVSTIDYIKKDGGMSILP